MITIEYSIIWHFSAVMSAAHLLASLSGRFQSDKEETRRKPLFVSTRRVRPFQQGSEKEHGTELKLAQKFLLISRF